MRFKYLSSLITFLFIITIGCNNSKIEYLNFDISTANNLKIDSIGAYKYRLLTKDGDPFVLLKGLKKPLSEHQTVLTFEYESEKRINFLEIFFISENTGSFGSNISGSIKCPALEPTKGANTYSVDLSEYIEDLNWNPKEGRIRLDFGDQSNTELLVNNIFFREQNVEEKIARAEKNSFKLKDDEMNIQLEGYLSNKNDSYITHVEVLDSTVLIKGNYAIDKGKPTIYPIKPWESILDSEKFLGKELPTSPFSIEINRYVDIDGFTYDQALSKWIIMNEGQMISSARYSDHIKSAQTMSKGVLKGRKGIGGYHIKRGYSSDLTSLPISSITVNIGITRMMYLEEREHTIAHNFGGKTYYFDSDIVIGLDNTMLEAKKHNIIVAAIILVNPANQASDPIIGKMLQDEHFEGDKAFFTMPNMTSIESVNCYAAALDFLSSRYNRNDNKYGRIHHWIMHNEVDAGNVWTNMGSNRPLYVFLDAYHKSMRLCYNIVRKYDIHSEVFASFTHSWSDPVPVDGDYSTVELLNGLLKYSKVEGDFMWGLAYHPYPEDLNEPKTWNDKLATFSMKTPMVTFKNLEVLDKWVKLSENKYMGTQKRSVWLSENGTNSRTYSELDLAEQAAGFAYAWKKMKNLDGIDAFQWHNWMDSRGEFGLRIGLRKYPDDEIDPAGKKPVWYLFQAADTPNEDKLFEPYMSMIGIDDWKEIMKEVE